LGAPGVSDSLKTGLSIGLPPVMKAAHDSIRDKVVMECLRGEKRIVLAITDHQAGSDVAGLTCTAVKSTCGKFYVVSGSKKWITNGINCDFFTTAVRTGAKGMKGLSLILVEK
jgi:alkylation response protein AidB-like acyl-CoA dehydrogenase